MKYDKAYHSSLFVYVIITSILVDMAISQPEPKSLFELLSNKWYQVPVYQRSYSWGISEAGQLWNDLSDNKPPYFLGILIFRAQKASKSLEVVDGQQRLATLILLLRAAVETLDSGSKERNTLDNLINQTEFGEDKPKFTLTLNKRDDHKFATLLSDNTTYQKPKWVKSSPLSNKNLQEVKDLFIQKFADLKEKGGTNAIIEFIKNKVLKSCILHVHLETDSDVYLFFETLNDRGMDLSIEDLVKNRVCGVVGEMQASSVANKIDNISDLLGAGRMKPFLLHYSWALSEDDPPPARKSLMEWYNTVISTEKSEFINKLSEYADIYYEIIEPRKHDRSQNKEVLTYLKVLSASRCYPLLLVGTKSLSSKNFLRLSRLIEVLTFRHSTIAKRDAKNLEYFYQLRIRDIKNDVDFETITNYFKKECAKINDEIFRANFKEYETEYSQIAKYILLKIENEITGGKSAELDWDKLTLDHILAKGLNWEGNDEYKHRLGNMTLLSDPHNKTLGNKEFYVKKEGYRDEKHVKITKDLASYLHFTKETIVERQVELAELATKIWDAYKI